VRIGQPVDGDDSTYYTSLTRKWGIVIGVVSLISSFAIEHYWLHNKGKLIGFSILMSLSFLRTSYYQLRLPRIRLLVSAWIIGHIFLNFLPLYDNAYPGAVFIPIALADYILFFFSLKAAYNRLTA
jgi:hypothetical protein